ncbi:hypothetical protein DPMN_185128 [Dreissena polymorpha]|uniref:Uncharacterized protein n=1 Tax=Dreissena polymorpha TaxID=45954 RepID=A0A9D4DKU4_DREPO|nr:hypothetical protein DPMN_185128 [Dreissena polymorpha]
MPDTSGLHVCHHSYDSQCQFLMPGMGCCRNHDLVKIHYDHSKTHHDHAKTHHDHAKTHHDHAKIHHDHANHQG